MNQAHAQKAVKNRWKIVKGDDRDDTFLQAMMKVLVADDLKELAFFEDVPPLTMMPPRQSFSVLDNLEYDEAE